MSSSSRYEFRYDVPALESNERNNIYSFRNMPIQKTHETDLRVYNEVDLEHEKELLRQELEEERLGSMHVSGFGGRNVLSLRIYEFAQNMSIVLLQVLKDLGSIQTYRKGVWNVLQVFLKEDRPLYIGVFLFFITIVGYMFLADSGDL